jgi:hypothetical protein
MSVGSGLPKTRRLESQDSCPVEHSFPIRLLGGLGGAAASGTTGYYPEENWGEIEELRSCIDLNVEMPIVWTTDTSMVVRIYTVVERMTTLVQEMHVARLYFVESDDGQSATVTIRVKGSMPHAWKITAATQHANPYGDGKPIPGNLTLIASGTCCADPFVSGEDGSKALSPGPYPPVAALMMNWDPVTSSWVPATGGAVHGLFLGSTQLTSPTGTFLTSPNTTKIRIRGVGGGGGGGGCAAAAGAGAGGGGGAGSYAEQVFTVTPSTSYAYRCGLAGLGISGAGGGNGGNSSFTVGAATVVAPGGQGAPVSLGAPNQAWFAGGLGGSAAVNDLTGSTGAPGDQGDASTVVGGASGTGGSSPFGGGGLGVVNGASGGDGIAATGFGAGGSGGLQFTNVARAGGDGSAGEWIVDEYS